MSQSPEEQPSPGVLGRIGSWLSPWRGKTSSSSTEDASPTSDRTPRLQCDKVPPEGLSVPWKGEQQGDQLGFSSQDDASQSTHTDCSSLASYGNSSEPGGGAGVGEGRITGEVCAVPRSKDRADGGTGNEASGRATQLKSLPCRSERGVAWESAGAQTQERPQAGRTLRVYLEETSVSQNAVDPDGGDEVVCTRLQKSICTRSRPSRSHDSSDGPNVKEQTLKQTVLSSPLGSQSSCSTRVAVTPKDLQDTPTGTVQGSESDSMGRKNSNRRKSQKNSQGDGGTKAKAAPATTGSPTSDKPEINPGPLRVETGPGGSTSTGDKPVCLATPEGERGTFHDIRVEAHADSQGLAGLDTGSPVLATLAVVVDGMEDVDMEGSPGEVVRKTESAESKRRSIKVSRSEVKFFAKKVFVNSESSPKSEEPDFTTERINADCLVNSKPTTETSKRLPEVRKGKEEPKPGRIADKICLFEGKVAGNGRGTNETPRSADASPSRKRLKSVSRELGSPSQRVKSAERAGNARASSAPPIREPLKTVKERAKNFAEAHKIEDKTSQTLAMTGMPKKCISSVTVAKSTKTEQDLQGKLANIHTSETASKSENDRVLAGPDGTMTDMAIVMRQQADDETNKTERPKPEDPVKPTQTDLLIPSMGPDDSSPPEPAINPSAKATKPAFRTKKRKSNSTVPVSPTSNEVKPEPSNSEQEVLIGKGGTEDCLNASKDVISPVERVIKIVASPQSDMSGENTQSASINRKSDLSEKQGNLIPVKVNISDQSTKENKDFALPPAITNDTTAIAGQGSKTKNAIVVEADILPQKDETAERHRSAVVQEKGNASPSSRSQPTETQRPPVLGPNPLKQVTAVKKPTIESKQKQGEKINTKMVEKENRQLAGKESVLQPEKKQPENIPQHVMQEIIQAKKISFGSEQSTPETGESKAQTQKEPLPIKQPSKEEPKLPRPTRQSSEIAPTPPALSSHTQPCIPTNTALSKTDPDKIPSIIVTQADSTQTQTEDAEPPAEPLNSKPATKEQKKEAHPEVSPAKEKQPITAITGEIQDVPPSTKKPEIARACTHTARDSATSKPDADASAAPDMTVETLVDALETVGSTQGIIAAAADKPGEKEPSATPHEVVPDPVGPKLEVEKKSDDVVDTAAIIAVKAVPSQLRQVEGHATQSLPLGNPTEAASEVVQTSPPPTVSTATSHTFDKVSADKMVGLVKAEPPATVNGDSDQRLSSQKANGTPASLGSEKATKPPFPAVTLPQMSASPNKLPPVHVKLSSKRDAPSSWLDVDFPQQKLCFSEPTLGSSASEGNLRDTSGDLDDDFVEKIKKLCAPFSLPPRKHNHVRPPQPRFAMPAIREDRFEKNFDPDEFKFGLRKVREFESTASLLSKLQSPDTKIGPKIARVSVTERSSLLGMMDSRSRTPLDKEDNTEETGKMQDSDDMKAKPIKVKSRLEGSCILSSLRSSSTRVRRAGSQSDVEATSSGDVSPSEIPRLSPHSPVHIDTPFSPQLNPPSTPELSPPTVPQLSPYLGTRPPLPYPISKEKSTPGNGMAEQSVVCDSGPPLPCFNDIKLPDYLEKYLPKELSRAEQNNGGQDQLKMEQMAGKMTPLVPLSGEDIKVNVGALASNEAPLPASGTHKASLHNLPEVPCTLPPGPAEPPANRGDAKGFHKRPGKIVLFERAAFGGHAFEVFRDMADATSLQLSPRISVKVVRGCWLLYEKPGFMGRTIALEEGPVELSDLWTVPTKSHPQVEPFIVIGSIRLAVMDYSLPHIDLYAEPEGHGRVTPYHDDAQEIGSFSVPQSTASIKVHSGVWQVFSDPHYQGMLAVLEKGEYSCHETWGFPSPFIGSLRPLKMGLFKVEHPNEVKALVYELPGFKGACLQIDGDFVSFTDGGDKDVVNGVHDTLDSKRPKAVGSLKIIGGLWVGFDQPGFEGHQHVLEEGEYLDWSDWGGGSQQLLSIRPVLADFMSPHLKLFSDVDFGKLGVNVDIAVPVPNMADTGYGVKTSSVEVIGGVWVVFEEAGFSGESYVLEKGLYGTPGDWGAVRPRIFSVMPVVLDDFRSASKFKVELFSQPGFQGSSHILESSVPSLPGGFTVGSCRVLAGSWVAFEGQGFTEKMYVLDVGTYPDLRSMGCLQPNPSVLSLQTTGFEFSLPSVILFERCDLRGKRLELTAGSVNLPLVGGCSRIQSLRVEGGIWVLYEGINYRGDQILLKPCEITDWRRRSGWQQIGSLRPIVQKQIHFRVKNTDTGLLMSVTGELDDVKLMRIQATEDMGGDEQIWLYQDGHLRCKLLEESCMGPSGSVIIAGSRLGLSSEPRAKSFLWSVTPEGHVRYTSTPDLLLDIKGGQNYDKNIMILNRFDPSKMTQRWVLEIL